jgi:hypothetical protein
MKQPLAALQSYRSQEGAVVHDGCPVEGVGLQLD